MWQLWFKISQQFPSVIRQSYLSAIYQNVLGGEGRFTNSSSFFEGAFGIYDNLILFSRAKWLPNALVAQWTSTQKVHPTPSCTTPCLRFTLRNCASASCLTNGLDLPLVCPQDICMRWRRDPFNQNQDLWLSTKFAHWTQLLKQLTICAPQNTPSYIQ